MFSRWPIHRKLVLGAVLLLVSVMSLAVSSIMGVYDYRSLAKYIRLRAPELPMSSELSSDVSKLSVAFELYRQTLGNDNSFVFASVEHMLVTELEYNATLVRDSFTRYRETLESNRQDTHYGRPEDAASEKNTADEFERVLADVESQISWDPIDQETVALRLERLEELSRQLPRHLHSRMENFAYEIRGKYHFLIGLTWTMASISACLLALFCFVFKRWIFEPLQILIHGSRRVAAGDFGHRIHLRSQDEIAELALAMNKMTHRFQEIRDELDQKVQERTQEVVRSEQLASVGFLAAGVAHEINNPLASIALCAESLEERVAGIIQLDDEKPDDQHEEEISVLRTYLKMIQDEAFRCKEITEKLLDFSRLGDMETHPTDLTELADGVIEMVGHIGRYKEKVVRFHSHESVIAPVNSQKMKQVILNLVTNALDSLDPGGHVEVRVFADGQKAHIEVKDNGCGMTDEVKKNIFEPFFTRRRDGQGTGLGMSITYRIITDHGGDIEVTSDGPGKGSRFLVTIPRRDHEQTDQRKAAA